MARSSCRYERFTPSTFRVRASRSSSLELIHALKVVSDSGGDSLEKVKPATVSEWIGAVVPKIASAVDDLAALALEQQRRRGAPAGYAELLGSCRMSVTQQRELERLLRNWLVLQGEGSADSVLRFADGVRDGRELLERFRAATEGQPF